MNNNKNDRQLRLAAFGFDDRAQQSFRMTFRGPGRGKALLVDRERADFGIINLDSADAQRLLDEYRRRYPGRPAIKLSVRDEGGDDAFFIKKPASIDAMLGAVERLIDELERHDCGKTDTVTAKAATPAAHPKAQVRPVKRSAKPRAGLYYSPKDYLQGEIHAAIDYSNRSGLVVELWLMWDERNWKKIVFLPRLQKVLTSMTEMELRTRCASPLCLMNHKLYRRNEKESAQIQARIEKEHRGITYEALLWKVGLYTSQGRLPEGTRIDTAARLKHWPNLTRLYPVADSMRIATLLVDQPRPLPLIAKVLKLPLGRVFAFYSAACAIGIAGVELAELSKPSLPQRHRDHTLFGRILKRLKQDEDPDFEVYA